jgi:hypothetical protein
MLQPAVAAKPHARVATVLRRLPHALGCKTHHVSLASGGGGRVGLTLQRAAAG